MVNSRVVYLFRVVNIMTDMGVGVGLVSHGALHLTNNTTSTFSDGNLRGYHRYAIWFSSCAPACESSLERFYFRDRITALLNV